MRISLPVYKRKNVSAFSVSQNQRCYFFYQCFIQVDTRRQPLFYKHCARALSIPVVPGATLLNTIKEEIKPRRPVPRQKLLRKATSS